MAAIVNDSQDVPATWESQRVASQAIRLVRWKGMLSFLAGVLTVFVALSIIDGFLRREEAGLRWLSLLAALTATAFLAYRLLLPALRFRATTIDVAKWIESKRPDLAGKLSTAVELAGIASDDVRFGSRAFREAALANCSSTTDLVQWDKVVAWSPIKRRAVSLGCVVALGAALTAVWPESSGLALRRLLMPWSSERWPRRDQLQIVNLPKAIGHGEILHLEVVDQHPPLPDDVTVELRFAGANNTSVLAIPARSSGDVAIADLPPLHQDVEVRAIGGDDYTMPWQLIQTIDVPQWKSHEFEITTSSHHVPQDGSQATSGHGIHTPTTTRIQKATSIQIPAGTRVRFRGELNQLVRGIEIVPQQSSNPWTIDLHESGNSVSLTNSDGQPIELLETTSWKFRFGLDNDQTVDSPTEWKIEVVADLPPEVVFETLNSSLAQGAAISLAGLARDDYGLRDLKVKMVAQSTPDSVIEIPLDIPSNPREVLINTDLDFMSAFRHQGHEIAAGEQLVVWLEAHDQLGQLGKSPTAEVTIRSPQQQLEILAQRQGPITQRVRELVELQRTSQQFARETGQRLLNELPDQQHADAIAGVVQIQQSINGQLSQSSHSIEKQIEQTLEQLAQNRLSDSDLSRELESLLEFIRSDTLDRAEAALHSALRTQAALQLAPDNPNDSSSLQSTVAELDRAQSDSLESLSHLLSQLDSSEALEKLRQGLMQIATQQHRLTEQTNKLHLESLRGSLDDVDSRASALSEQQLALASELEQWFMQWDQQSAEIEQSPSGLPGLLQTAAESLARVQAATNMRKAGKSIEAEQLGDAVQLQEQIDQAFQEATGTMNEDRTTSLPQTPREELPPQLSHVGKMLEPLIEAQETLLSHYGDLAEQIQSSKPSDEIPHQIQETVARQAALRRDLSDVMNVSADWPLFTWTLEQADRDMAKAIAATQRHLISPDAIHAAESALAKLTAVANAVPEMESEQPNAGESSESNATTDKSSSEESNSMDSLKASLKLIRGYQWEVNRQTAALDSIADQDYRDRRQSELVAQQNELAKRLEQLSRDLDSTQPNNRDAAQP